MRSEKVNCDYCKQRIYFWSYTISCKDAPYAAGASLGSLIPSGLDFCSAQCIAFYIEKKIIPKLKQWDGR